MIGPCPVPTGLSPGRARTAGRCGAAAPTVCPASAFGPGERLEVTAAADAFGTDVLVRREPGRAVRAAPRHAASAGRWPTPVEAWAERLDPDTLEVTASTPRLPGGTYWPGGIAAHANGDLHMVFGRWVHRLTPDLEVLASHRLPVPRPHNSFVVLDGGELVTKDCDAPAGLEPSTVLRARSRDAAAGGPGAAAPRAVDRAAGQRRRERDRRRDHRRLPAAARPRRRAADDRRRVAAVLRPGSRAQLRLGPGDNRRARPLDGQRAQPRGPHDAGHGGGARPGAAVVGSSRRRPGGALGGDQRAPVRHRVEPAGLGSRAAGW